MTSGRTGIPRSTVRWLSGPRLGRTAGPRGGSGSRIPHSAPTSGWMAPAYTPRPMRIHPMGLPGWRRATTTPGTARRQEAKENLPPVTNVAGGPGQGHIQDSQCECQRAQDDRDRGRCHGRKRRTPSAAGARAGRLRCLPHEGRTLRPDRSGNVTAQRRTGEAGDTAAWYSPASSSPSFRRSCSLPGCSAWQDGVSGAAGAYDLTAGAWRFSWKIWMSLSWVLVVSVSIRRALGLPRSAG